jgi:transcriptional regulator with XRE-family HTH domain
MKGPTLQERLGKSLRKRREAMGLSQEAFADQIEMHRTYYSALERGEKNLTVGTLERICTGQEARVSDVVRDAED